jgi:hypothetical protein
MGSGLRVASSLNLFLATAPDRLFSIKRRREKVALQHHVITIEITANLKKFEHYYTEIKSRPREITPPGPTTLFSNWGNN